MTAVPQRGQSICENLSNLWISYYGEFGRETLLWPVS
jgi:hypothetical protein